MWWAVWCAILVAGGAGAAAAPAPDSLSNLAPLDLVQIDPPAPDDEGVSYEIPAMSGRYASGSPWLYLLTEMPRDSQVASSDIEARQRRQYFSPNPAADLLRRMAINNIYAQQMINNRAHFEGIGKREFHCDAVKVSSGVKRVKVDVSPPVTVLVRLFEERQRQLRKAAKNRGYMEDLQRIAKAWRAERRAHAGETQDAFAVDQQPHGSAAAEVAAGSSAQADARGEPEASRRQQTVSAKRWKTRILGEICVIPLRQLELPPLITSFRCKLLALPAGARCCVN